MITGWSWSGSAPEVEAGRALASAGPSTMSGPVWKVAVNKNFDFQSFAICQNFRKNMNEDVHNLPDDEPSIFFDVHMRL